MAKKKEPINITPPTPEQFLVKAERVKVIVMFIGAFFPFAMSKMLLFIL